LRTLLYSIGTLKSHLDMNHFRRRRSKENSTSYSEFLWNNKIIQYFWIHTRTNASI